MSCQGVMIDIVKKKLLLFFFKASTSTLVWTMFAQLLTALLQVGAHAF